MKTVKIALCLFLGVNLTTINCQEFVDIKELLAMECFTDPTDSICGKIIYLTIRNLSNQTLEYSNPNNPYVLIPNFEDDSISRNCNYPRINPEVLFDLYRIGPYEEKCIRVDASIIDLVIGCSQKDQIRMSFLYNGIVFDSNGDFIQTIFCPSINMKKVTVRKLLKCRSKYLKTSFLETNIFTIDFK